MKSGAGVRPETFRAGVWISAYFLPAPPGSDMHLDSGAALDCTCSGSVSAVSLLLDQTQMAILNYPELHLSCLHHRWESHRRELGPGSGGRGLQDPGQGVATAGYSVGGMKTLGASPIDVPRWAKRPSTLPHSCTLPG